MASAAARAQWTSVGDGIDYQEFSAAGPNNLFVARMTRSNTNTTIDTTVAYDMMAGAKEIVRNQAARLDDAITWWGGSWGARNDVVVAINGGFYNTTTGVIDGGQVQSGWHSHWFADRGSFSGFAWKTDRTAFLGECVDYTAAKVYVRFLANGASQAIDGINRDPGTSDLVIFTPQYDNQTPSGTRTEVLVEGTQGPLVLLLHGFPENWRCWIHQIPALVEAGFRVIVPDQRGYNQSEQLCRGIGFETGLAVRTDCLARTRYTKSQAAAKLHAGAAVADDGSIYVAGTVNSAAPAQARRRVSMVQSRTMGMNWG